MEYTPTRESSKNPARIPAGTSYQLIETTRNPPPHFPYLMIIAATARSPDPERIQENPNEVDPCQSETVANSSHQLQSEE